MAPLELTDRIRNLEDRFTRVEARQQASEIVTEEMRVGLMQSIEHVADTVTTNQKTMDKLYQKIEAHTLSEEADRRMIMRMMGAGIVTVGLGLGGWVLATVAALP
jgi:hypothetical protein